HCVLSCLLISCSALCLQLASFSSSSSFFFFFNDTSPTVIYTLSLHDALPISLTNSFVSSISTASPSAGVGGAASIGGGGGSFGGDRKSTRLNSSHVSISYAVFCLKKKKKSLHK